MELEKITSAIESILFASDRPVSVGRLKEVFGEEGPLEETLSEALAVIKERYMGPGFGFELRAAQGGFQFVTRPENAEIIRKFLETKPFRLGRSALETLAIISYRQPITRAEIDQVRGIDSSHLMRTLIERGLVKMAGKADVPGRPVQYATTPRFLEVLGLSSLSELPPLTELDQLQGDTVDPMKTLEEGLDRFIHAQGEKAEDLSAEDKEELAEIETMLDSAKKGTREIHQSALHAEIAEENENAVAALQSHPRPRKKKNTVTYEEITHSEMASKNLDDEALMEMPIIDPNNSNEPPTVN
ncbi:MAG: SMC-Scp complex subunit ScpB [Deltaproteobacteria bacterium]|nr:SMC-Scp complex subunit ScpB [Deltaproteobacteria bacterium]